MAVDNNLQIINSIFPIGVLYQLNFIKDDIEVMDNNIRADKIMKLLKGFDFSEVGCGTNRIVVTHPHFEQFVFKIALDERGVVDNNVEFKLSRRLQPYVTLCYETSGIVAVSERVDVMSSGDFEDNFNRIQQITMQISTQYVINDIGPKSFMNWGIRGYDPVILDYAYLSKLSDIDPDAFFCSKEECGGRLRYSDDLTEFECTECGAIYTIGEIVGSPADELTELGFTTPDLVNGVVDESLGDDDISYLLNEIGFLSPDEV